MGEELWKYCSKDQWEEMLLAMELLGRGVSIRTNQQALRLLYILSNHQKEHYRKTAIPKKSGGCRYLQVPDTLLKKVQQNIDRRVLYHFPVSPYACAYKKGADVRKNALPHVGKKTLLKLDIKDFFDSITYLMVYNLAFPGDYFPAPVRTLLTSLCCLNDSLPQGSPASPRISNLVLRPFDDYIGRWCEERGIAYTRYCDDMTFSGEFLPGEVRNKVCGFLRVLGFELNNRKTVVAGRGQRQTVTGIAVSEKLQVTKEYRRKLRQEVYYCLRYGAVSHLTRMEGRNREITAKEVIHYLSQLLGKIDYVLYVNPKDTWFGSARCKVREYMRFSNFADLCSG